jgi:uncharacterized NAD(P)/FAD-binding protein YdhS
MSEVGKKLKTVLEGYAQLLRDRDLAPAKHESHLVRWVREFLLFAEERGGYTFEQMLDLFLAAVIRRFFILIPPHTTITALMLHRLTIFNLMRLQGGSLPQSDRVHRL